MSEKSIHAALAVATVIILLKINGDLDWSWWRVAYNAILYFPSYWIAQVILEAFGIR